MNEQDDGKIVQLITRHQGALLGYIVSLLYRPNDARDVLQETNLILWQKRSVAPQGEDFIRWACKIAYFQVLSHRKRNQRSRLFFSEDLIRELADDSAEPAAHFETKSNALQHCIAKLSKDSRELLRQRYFVEVSVIDIASEAGRSTKAISQMLYRIRKSLLDCIRTRVESMEGGST